jgi:hypothetical protein
LCGKDEDGIVFVSIKKEPKPSRNTVKHQRRSTQYEAAPRLGIPSSIKNTISTIVEESKFKGASTLRDSSKKK